MDIAAQIIEGLVVAGLVGVAAVGWRLNNSLTRLTVLVREMQRQQDRQSDDIRELYEFRRQIEVKIEGLQAGRNGRSK